MNAMVIKLHEYMKKRGFSETLQTLYSAKDHKMPQKAFFERFEKEQSYYNAYLLVKDILLDQNLIKFELDENINKVIGLTEKGKTIFSKILEIEELLS